jgi:hypothetical protein
LYCAEIISPCMVYPSHVRRSLRIFFRASTLVLVAYQLYRSTAFLDFSTTLKRIFALDGFGRFSRVYLFGIVNATICFHEFEIVSITGVFMAIDSEFFIVSMTGTVIEIDDFAVFPPKIYPASCRNPLLRAVLISPSTSTSATI